MWAHMDIGGSGIVSLAATGWGTRLLIEYARFQAKKGSLNANSWSFCLIYDFVNIVRNRFNKYLFLIYDDV